MRIILSGLCFRGAEGREHRAFERVQRGIGGNPRARIVEPADIGVASQRRQRFDLLDGGGKVALTERSLGPRQNGARLGAARVLADAADRDRRFGTSNRAVEE